MREQFKRSYLPYGFEYLRLSNDLEFSASLTDLMAHYKDIQCYSWSYFLRKQRGVPPRGSQE